MMRGRRQLVTGLLAIPVSLLPFLAYGAWTPQGRLLTDELRVRFDPPQVEELEPELLAEVERSAPRYSGSVLPLVYHGVGSGSSGEGDYSVSPERFAEHLAALDAAGMRFVTAEEVAEAFSGGRPLPDNAVLITFDDARKDALLWATPLLEQVRARATMFVIGGATDDPGLYYAGWDELSANVWDVQSHTFDLHHDQDTPDGDLPALTSRAAGETTAEWRRRVRADLDRVDQLIVDETGRPPLAFAYPFGAWGGDRTNDPELAGLLHEELARRYVLGFHQDGQDTMVLASPAQDPHGLRRLQVEDWDGAELIRRIAAAAERTPATIPVVSSAAGAP